MNYVFDGWKYTDPREQKERKFKKDGRGGGRGVIGSGTKSSAPREFSSYDDHSIMQRCGKYDMKRGVSNDLGLDDGDKETTKKWYENFLRIVQYGTVEKKKDPYKLVIQIHHHAMNKVREFRDGKEDGGDTTSGTVGVTVCEYPMKGMDTPVQRADEIRVYELKEQSYREDGDETYKGEPFDKRKGGRSE